MLYKKSSNGRYRLATDEEVFIAAAERRRLLFPQGKAIESPTAAYRLFRDRLAHLPHEVFCCLFLDTRHRVLSFDELFRGTIDGAAVYPREIVKRALALNAAAVILSHNHPSGDCEPSEADRAITVRVSKALSLVDVRLLDHLVIGGDQLVSLAERGWF
jgi:DNA repair protein RadC